MLLFARPLRLAFTLAAVPLAAAPLALHAGPMAVELPAVALPPCAAGERPPASWSEPAAPLTVERIRQLPADQQEPWITYLENSNRRRQLATAGRAAAKPAKHAAKSGAAVSRGLKLDAQPDYYRSDAAAELADRVVTWQIATGGWVKGSDYTRNRMPEDDQQDVWSLGTFDNSSTLQELRFLARMITAAAPGPRREAWQAAFRHGLDYIGAAQYPNGGFPQIYPLAGVYHDAVTFNDDAFVLILNLLADVAGQKADFAFVSAAEAADARQRLDRGIKCVLKSQLVSPTGVRTVWGQQHDPLTLAPAPARNFEPIAATASESVGLTLFLMSLPAPGPEVIQAIEGSVAWLNATALQGYVWDAKLETGNGLVKKDGAAPLWARFYELGTSRPIFGDRDRSIHYAVTELSAERRTGYSWLNSRAASLPAAYAKWKKRLR